MRTTTLLGAALIALSTVAVAQVATDPVENKTDLPAPADNVSAPRPADNTSATAADNAVTPIEPASGDPESRTAAPPK